MTVTLWPHQAAAAHRIQAGEIQALWWSMRCGKTLATIAGTDDGDRLIICPNSVKPTWVADLAAWGQDSYIWGNKPRPKARPRNVVINYESLWRSPLLTLGFDSVIFDESLRLQNPHTKLFQHIQDHMQLLCRARVILLSGSPCPEGWHQLITQSIAASGQFLGHLDPWTALRWGWVYDDDRHKWNIQPGIEEQCRGQLNDLGPVMTQQEAGILTRKLYQRMPVPVGPREVELWKQATKCPGLEGPQLGQVAQSCASGRDPATGVTSRSTKLDAVVEWVADLDQQVVILCWFRASLEYLVAELVARGLRVGAIHGEDDGAAARGRTMDQFSAGALDVLVGNVAVVKVGVNLSAASTLVFAENSYSGEARIQAEERCTIRGKDAVEIVDFISTSDGNDLLGYIDDYILEAVRDKRDFSAQALRRSTCGTRTA
jgi:hypothetical protein